MFQQQATIDNLKTIMKRVLDVLEKDILQKNKYVYDAYNTSTKPYFDSIYNIILELEQLPLQYLPSNESYGEISAPIQQIDALLQRISQTIDGISSEYNQAAPQVSSLQYDYNLSRMKNQNYPKQQDYIFHILRIKKVISFKLLKKLRK